MKLSELVAFRNRLEKITVGDAQTLAKKKLDELLHYIEQPLEQPMEELTAPYMDQLYQCEQELYQSFDRLHHKVEIIKQRVRDQITDQERFWFQESYRLFEEAETCETNDQILNVRRGPTGNSMNVLRARLSNYSDWRFPGMIIRPGKEDFVEDMVGFDPLYIVDQNYELLRPCIKRWPVVYQNRLRPYIINDWSDDPLLGKIPNDQFGVCVAYNVLNYRPLEMIRRYLKEIYQKLRPGGVLLMTFNDCDREKAVMLVERFSNSYTPGYLVRDLASVIGFNLTHTWCDDGPSVWLELRKPGELTSLRGGQVIARICQMTDYLDDVDFVKRRPYTQDEAEKIQQKAKDLNIDDAVIKSSRPGELQFLIKDLLDKKFQEEKLEQLKQTARNYDIDVEQPTWQQQIKEILEREHEQARLDEEQRRKDRLLEVAKQFQLDIDRPDWEVIVEEFLRKKAEEDERKRVKDIHDRARTYGVDPDKYNTEEEIILQTAEAVDRSKKEELIKLRQRAMQLNAGDTNLIRYGYSAEKLKQLIKAKEEGQ